MKRLWVRLTLAFVGVILVGVVAVAVLADLNTSQAFQQYVARQDVVVQSGLLDDLAVFYKQHGNWEGVESVMSTAPGTGTGPNGQGHGQKRGHPTLVLAESNGRIVYDEQNTRTGDTLTADERASALPVVLDGRTVGLLVVGGSTSGTLPPSALSFLDNLRRSLLITALAVGALGILLSLLISRTLTAPLADLVKAARAFAARNWNYQVKVGGTSEISEVGRAFHEMARELQAGETARRNLVADIAHELRTPLAVMQGNLQAMLDEVYPLEQREIATLYDQTRLLARLVDDLRELSLADAGQLPLHVQSIDPLPVMRATAEQFAFVADAQHVSIEFTTDETLLQIQADPARLAQILRNLLTNALRHTPSGGTIRLIAKADTSMHFTISDTGEGIASEDLPHIFERFYRADKARPRTQDSTGLGLAICQAWVKAMGGKIGAESTPGQGSRFWFTLPLAEKKGTA